MSQQKVRIKNDIFDEFKDYSNIDIPKLISIYFILLTKADFLREVETNLKFLRENLGYKASNSDQREELIEIIKVLDSDEIDLIEIKDIGGDDKNSCSWSDRLKVKIKNIPERKYTLINPKNREILNISVTNSPHLLAVYLLLSIKSNPNYEGYNKRKTILSIEKMEEYLDISGKPVQNSLNKLEEKNLIQKITNYNVEKGRNDTNIYWIYDCNHKFSSKDKKKVNEAQKREKLREKYLNLIIKQKKFLPALLIGEYVFTLKYLLKKYKKCDFLSIKRLNIDDTEAIREWRERYLGIEPEGYYDVITLIDLRGSKNKRGILKLVEKYGDNIPIILYSRDGGVESSLKSRTYNFKETSDIKKSEFEFKDIQKTINRLYKEDKNYSITQSKIKKIVIDENPKLLGCEYRNQISSNQIRLDKIISELSGGYTYQEVLE